MAPPGCIAGEACPSLPDGGGTGAGGTADPTTVNVELQQPPPTTQTLDAGVTTAGEDATDVDAAAASHQRRVPGCIRRMKRVKIPTHEEEMKKCFDYFCIDFLEECSGEDDQVLAMCLTCCCPQRCCYNIGALCCCSEKPPSWATGDQSETLPLLAPLMFLMLFIVVTQTMVSYGVLLYGRGGPEGKYYSDTPFDEFKHRSTWSYGECVWAGDPLTVWDTVKGFL